MGPLAEELLPNTILLDFNLEGNTLDGCRRLRANRVLQAMPILMLCDYDDRDSRALGLSAGINDFISKPFDGVKNCIYVTDMTALVLSSRLKFRSIALPEDLNIPPSLTPVEPASIILSNPDR